jgi:choline dehydrogenase-like flavoprotein
VTDEAPAQVCIVGAGAAGGLLCRLLAEAGLDVVALEAGPWYADPRAEFAEDELAMQKTWWPESQYSISGDARRGRLSSGHGVGGGTLVWTGAAFRFLDDDFRVLSLDGQLPGASIADWPTSASEMAPYYDATEAHVGVAGALGPWDPPDRKPYPLPPHGLHHHSVVLRAGFTRLGLRAHPGPMAIASRPRPNREACCYCGFCIQGCRTGAMYSPATAELPWALATGRVRLRPDAVALRVATTADGATAESVEYGYRPDGSRHRQPAEVVVVASNPLEIPRLLLNSRSAAHPAGLANSSDQVGRHLMNHPSAYAWGVFDEDMKPWEGFVLNHLCCLDYARTRPEHPFIRGFVMETTTGLPVNVATSVTAEYWGAPHKALMRSYRKLAGLFTICEGIPSPTNRVTTRPEALDEWGLPRAHLHYDWHMNDVRMMDWAFEKSAEVLRAAGARQILRPPPVQVHMMGTARMGDDPRCSVTSADGQSHDVPNLYVAGGALFPTGSCVNPTLTILALAWRTAEHIARRFGKTLQTTVTPLPAGATPRGSTDRGARGDQ